MKSGKEYPTNTPGNTNANRRIDARSYETVVRVNGKVTTTARVVVSADGKTRTITQTGTDSQGKPVHNVQVYERQ